MEIKATELDKKPTIIPLKGRSDGVAIKTIDNVSYITRMPRTIEMILGEVLGSNAGEDLDRIFSLFTDEERLSLSEHIKTFPDTKNPLKDLLGKLASSIAGKRFLREEGGRALERESIIIMIILWLTDNGFFIENYLQSTERSSLTDIVHIGKAINLTLDEFNQVNQKYWSGVLNTEGNFNNWKRLCNGTHEALNNSSSNT